MVKLYLGLLKRNILVFVQLGLSCLNIIYRELIDSSVDQLVKTSVKLQQKMSQHSTFKVNAFLTQYMALKLVL